MHNPGATFHINQHPVLPLADLLSQKTVETVVPLAIGVKIKSFKINEPNAQALNQNSAIELPNFANLDSLSLNVEKECVAVELLDLVPSYQCNLATVKRFWWQWLLSAKEKISILVLLILFQSSSQANNLLEKAKIYIDLDSQAAITLPPSGRAYLENSQASPFNRAIRQAREIEVDSPFYPQAQVDINRWSKTILDIAQGRAGEGDLTGAIAAAKLVPQNNASTELIARQATAAVEDWQLRARKDNLYQNYLIKAKTSITPDQASSYNQAIGILQKIVPGAEEYQEAQDLMTQWNKQIYLIAKNRADRGDFKQAVEAAVLVSQDSSYHQLAKDSINMKIKSMYAQYLK